MSTHGDFVSENIYVLLHEWHRLSQNIKACSHQINKENLVILNNTENSLVVVSGASRRKVYNDAR